MFSLRSSLFAIVIGGSIVFAEALGAATLHVPGQYPQIQIAIDAAQSGDTVLVAPGVYVEALTMKAGVTLKGSGWKKTVIDGGQVGNVISITGANVSAFAIEGFTLRNSNQGSSGFSNNAIFVNGQMCCSVVSNGSIRECRMEACGGGVYLANVHAGTITIERNQIVDVLYTGVSPYLGTLIVRNNTIVGCGFDGYSDNSGGGSVLLENNVIAFNGLYGVRSNQSTPITVQYNDVFGNGSGSFFQSSGAGASWNPSPGTNFSADPRFVDLAALDVHLAAGTPCLDAGNPATMDTDGSVADSGALAYDAGYVPPVAEPFGVACGGLQMVASGTPWAGSIGRFELGLSGAPPSAPVFLLVGLAGVPWSGLTLPHSFGADAPGCFLNAPPTLLLGFTAGPGGSLAFAAPLPEDPAVIGVPLALQWAAAAPGLNPLGYAFSEGLQLTIGD